MDIERINEVNALGVDAVLRRGHPQIIRLDVGAPGERQVVRLAVLQGDALHANPLAVLEVNSLQMEDTAVSSSQLCERRISSITLGAGCAPISDDCAHHCCPLPSMMPPPVILRS